MDINEIRKQIYWDINQTEWHFFKYHFSSYHPQLGEHPLAQSIIECCYSCEKHMKGYANNFIKKLCSFSNKEKYTPHFDQILQHLAELLVVSHLSNGLDETWSFSEEPTIGNSKKNPEIQIQKNGFKILVEVKSPKFTEYQQIRHDADVQIAGRYPFGFTVASALSSNEGNKALPRDNSVKDFLISTDEKFSAFKAVDKNYLSILVIAWDDFIYEPITALINETSGLLTEKSYFKGENDNPVVFENIDYIVVLRNMTQIANATRDIQVTDGLKHPLDYGLIEQTLPKALIEVNNHPQEDFVKELFQCERIEELQIIADYRPQEIIINKKM